VSSYFAPPSFRPHWSPATALARAAGPGRFAVVTTGSYDDPDWLTRIAAAKVAGTLPAETIPANVARTDADNDFAGAVRLAGRTVAVPGGDLSFNVRDYGAVPGGPDCSAAFQAAIDAAGAAGGGFVRAPGGQSAYVFYSPVFLDRDNVSLVGDGPDVTKLQGINPTQTFLYVWQRGTWGGSTLTPHVDVAAHLVSLSAAGISGVGGYGWNLKDDVTLQFVGTGFDQGPGDYAGWTGVDRCVLAFAIKSNAATWDSGTFYNLFGIFEQQGFPAPFAAFVSGNKVCLQLTTADGVKREFRVPINGSQQVQRVVLQIDLRTPEVVAFVQGVRVAVDDALKGEGWSGSLAFMPAWGTPFWVGRASDSFTSNDFAMLGLKFSHDPVYDGSVAVGEALARLDAATVTDANAFYTNDANTIAALSPPTSTAHNNWQVDTVGKFIGGVTHVGANTSARGLWVKKTHGVAETVNRPAVRDLSVEMSAFRHGAGIALGPAYDARIENVNVRGGAFCLATVRAATAYTTRVKDCTFSYATDHGVNLYFGIARFDNVDLKYCTRAPWLLRAVSATDRNGFYAPADTEVRVGTIFGPTPFVMDVWNADFESPGLPSDCYFHFEPTADSGLASTIQFVNCGGGGIADGRPYVRLKARHLNGAVRGTNYGRARLVVQGGFASYMSAAAACVVESDGYMWETAFDGLTTDLVPLAKDARGDDYTPLVGTPIVPAPSPPADPGAAFDEATLTGVHLVLRPDDLGVPDGAEIDGGDPELEVPREQVAGTVGSVTPAAGSVTYHAAVNGANGVVRFDTSSYLELDPPGSPAGGLTVVWATTATADVSHWDTRGVAGVWCAGSVVFPVGREPFLRTVGAPYGELLLHTVRVTDAPGRCVEYWVNNTLVERRRLNSDAAVDWGSVPTVWAKGGATAGVAGDLAYYFLAHAGLPDDELRWLQRKIMYRLGIPL
jgi:hypothetical protein